MYYYTQIDLIDMRCAPDDEFKWIGHCVDHFSKFHITTYIYYSRVLEIWSFEIFSKKKFENFSNSNKSVGPLELRIREVPLYFIMLLLHVCNKK